MKNFPFVMAAIVCGAALPGAAMAQAYGYGQQAAAQPGYAGTYSYGTQPQQPAYASPQHYYGATQQAAPAAQSQYAPLPATHPAYPQGAAQSPARAVSAGSLGATGFNINFPSEAGDDVDVLRLQVFLDYNGFSPGEIDGKWGYNTERALFVYQKLNGMSPTGQLDSKILARLDAFKDGYLLEYTLKGDDVKDRVGTIPRTYPEQSKLSWLPYESRAEALAEKFHMSQSLLRKLNPGVDLERVQPGQKLMALNVLDGIDTKRGKVALVRISKYNKWLMAYDDGGNLMFYYPCTLGSEKDPLPVGKTYAITTPVKNPPFKYKPENMWDDELGREYDIPPGPNSPVGNVWIGTTRKSVGIHGTPNPENISKNNSHGCIRLANWDANQLSARVGPGVTLEFVQ
jgi:lipoprotein-anchoring transpeptidase ErfK/SrfK